MTTCINSDGYGSIFNNTDHGMVILLYKVFFEVNANTYKTNQCIIQFITCVILGRHQHTIFFFSFIPVSINNINFDGYEVVQSSPGEKYTAIEKE